MNKIKKSAIPIIDLFAGPGGLGEGFSSLTDENGKRLFRIVLSIEKDKHAQNTLLLRSFYRQFPILSDIPEEYYEVLRGERTIESLLSLKAYAKQADNAKWEAWHAELGKTPDYDVDARILASFGDRRPENWVLIGGPPCQAYSTVGRSRKYRLGVKDHKHTLYEEYLRIIAVHKPSVFIMENVRGMLSSKIIDDNGTPVRIFDKIIRDLTNPLKAAPDVNDDNNNLRYGIYSLVKEPDVVNLYGEVTYKKSKYFTIPCEKFGIPQARHRVILLGIRDNFGLKYPGPLEPFNGDGREISAERVLKGLPRLRSGLSRIEDTKNNWFSVIDSMRDEEWLSELANDPETEGIASEIIRSLKKLRVPRKGRGGDFVRNDRRFKPSCDYRPEWFLNERIGGVCNSETKAHMETDLHRYFFAACYARYQERLDDERRKLLTLSRFPSELLPAHANALAAKGNDNFADRFRVQTRKKPASTIMSHISKDGHYYIHYDQSQCRSLTVREAARLQTFPDDYFFTGPRTEQYQQVGNAVPPLLARQIAEKVNLIFSPVNSEKTTDRLSKEKRSWNMSRIKGKNTRPELIVRSVLHRNGFRFRLHSRALPGTPDIILPKYKTVIFVNGCFWHRHSGCRFAYSPKSRKKFWEKKFSDNVKRDLKKKAELETLGWNVLVIWECEVKEEDRVRSRLSGLTRAI